MKEQSPFSLVLNLCKVHIDISKKSFVASPVETHIKGEKRPKKISILLEENKHIDMHSQKSGCPQCFYLFPIKPSVGNIPLCIKEKGIDKMEDILAENIILL
jgi:hypothetical protein